MQKMQTNNRGESQNSPSATSEVFPLIGKQFPEQLIPVINEAEREIKIIVFDWRWYPNTPGSIIQKFSMAIINAKKRGVKVSVIGNQADVLGVLSRFGCSTKKLITERLVHTKLMLIDDNITVLGSHNYTQNAFMKNYEASVMIYDKIVKDTFDDYFENLWLL